MQHIKNTIVFLLAAVVVLAAASANMAVAQEEEETEATVTGVIDAYDYDDDGNVSSVTLTSDDDTVYLVANDTVGKELFEMIGKTVAVSGFLGEDEEGYLLITVTSYTVDENE